jgi:multidrug transporter EmrE-like cation transporter
MNFFPVLLAIISIVLTAFGQLLLKIGANSSNGNRQMPQQLKPYLNQYSIPGYGLLFIVTVLSIYILEDLPLKVFFPLFISGNVITIAGLSYFLLHESITYRSMIGICLILSGILIFFL